VPSFPDLYFKKSCALTSEINFQRQNSAHNKRSDEYPSEKFLEWIYCN